MYEVTITNEGTSRFHVASKEYAFFVDTKGDGMTPPDTLLAALGSCVGVYINKYADGRKLALGSYDIKVYGELEQGAVVQFKAIAVDIRFDKPVEISVRESLMRFIANCPIHNTVKNGAHIVMKLV